ncbi:MAG TPA: molybdopterin-dependent oxidoreductase [Gaiellaceae bacterium]|nr:molybdopterin-dependent oxidoreductase [Gaiellaceae bacterium]
MNDRAIGRGAFLGIVAAGVGGLFVGRDIRDFLSRALPDGVNAIVPSGGWRIYTIAGSLPRLPAASYRLELTGLVDRPRSFRLADLHELPRAEQVSDFHCVTGWSVRDVRWAGVRLRDLLDAAAARPQATGVRFVSAEPGYHDSLTLEQALLPDVLLAYEMDGKPLSRAHGAPLRLVVPEMYGYKSVKWVRRIELLPHPVAGYWEQHGYDADAWIGHSNGRGTPLA